MADNEDFEAAFNYVVGIEGVFSDDPDDWGNWTGGQPGKGELRGTKFGISAKAYPALDIKNLTMQQARGIYYEDYWVKAHCPKWGGALGLAVFDCAVNQGVKTAIKCLQRAVGVNDDGRVGVHTSSAVSRLSVPTVVEYFQAERGLEYAEAPTWAKHRRGWMRRVIQTAVQAVAQS